MSLKLMYFAFTDDETSAIEEALTVIAAELTLRPDSFRSALEKIQEATGTVLRPSMAKSVMARAQIEVAPDPARCLPLSREIARNYPLAWNDGLSVVFPDQTRLGFSPQTGLAGLGPAGLASR